jgi:hypothetical protein
LLFRKLSGVALLAISWIFTKDSDESGYIMQSPIAHAGANISNHFSLVLRFLDAKSSSMEKYLNVNN